MDEFSSYSDQELATLRQLIDLEIEKRQSHCHDSHSHHSHGQEQDKDEQLESIIACIKKQLGDNILAKAPNESISIPTWDASFEECDQDTIVHVDSFLYDEDDVDVLVEEGLIHRHQCIDCGSKNIQDVTFISHSASLIQLRWLCEVALKQVLMKEDAKMVDVGSRIGAVLWTAYLYTTCPRIVGIEMNEYFCKLQSRVIKEQHISNRVSVIKGDVVSDSGKALLNGTLDGIQPTVIVFNNVFQFFVGQDEKGKGKGKGKVSPERLSGRAKIQYIWNELKDTILPGTILVTIPSLEEQFEAAQVDIDTTRWVEPLLWGKSEQELQQFQQTYSLDSDMLQELDNIYLYKVKD